MISTRLSFLVLIISVISCKPKPEDFLEKANQALKYQNVEVAIQYFQKAYELFLPKKHFILILLNCCGNNCIIPNCQPHCSTLQYPISP